MKSDPMIEKLKSDVTAKVDIEKYGFEWLSEPTDNFENFLDLARYVLSHKLNIVLAYHSKEEQNYIYFDHVRLSFNADLSDDFFRYLFNHYIEPAQRIGIHLSESEYSNKRVEYKDAFMKLQSKFSDLKDTKEYSIYMGEDDWCELMTYLENCMIMNPMITPHASLMHMATVHASDYTASFTQASTAQFYIDAPYSAGTSNFTLTFTYFPDKSKYNPVPTWIKRYKELAAVPAPMPSDIPKDLPIDVFGALFYLFGTP